MKSLTLAAALVLAACSPAIIGDPGTGPGDRPQSLCGADAYQHLLGKPKRTLEGVPLPTPVRVIGPDTAVTMDHVPERLNIRYDTIGIIREVSCG